MRRTRTGKIVQGNAVPRFRGITQDETEVTSSDLKGKDYILFFYNHDGSETCTKEACNMRDNYSLLSNLGYTIIGVSEDSVKKHQKFIAKYNLPFTLISDPDNTIAKAFDIYGEKEFMGRISDAVHRTTFVINKEGIIVSVIHPVDSSQHANQILQSLNITA